MLDLRHNGLKGGIAGEIGRTFDRQQFRQPLARPMNPALGGPGGAAADPSRVEIGHATNGNEQKEVTRIPGQLVERFPQFLVFKVDDLLGPDRQRPRVGILDVLNVAASPAALRIKVISQDCEQPSRHIGPRLETIDISAGAQKRLLGQILRMISIMGKGDCKGAQFWDQAQHLGTYARIHDLGSSTGLAASTAVIGFVAPPAASVMWGGGCHADSLRNFE
jgi:hypothetical protein